MNITQKYGLACPSGGRFYICQEEPRFMGCCDVDPCQKGHYCPSSQLRPSTFDNNTLIGTFAQACINPKGKYYTCISNTPRFMGCCLVQPCRSNAGCPANSLVAAQLSNDTLLAAPFLDSSVPSSASLVSTVPSVARSVSVTIDQPPPSSSTFTPAPLSDFIIDDPTTSYTEETSSTEATSSTEESTTTTTTPEPTVSATETPAAVLEGSRELSGAATAGVTVAGTVSGLLILGLLAFWIMGKLKRSGPGSGISYKPFLGPSRPFGESKHAAPDQQARNVLNHHSPESQAQGFYHHHHPLYPQQQHSPICSHTSPPFANYAEMGSSSSPVQLYGMGSNTAWQHANSLRGNPAPTVELSASPVRCNASPVRPHIAPVMSWEAYKGTAREGEVTGITSPSEVYCTHPVELAEMHYHEPAKRA
ncbi:hypothetical protein G7046_g765 [Stylonectria norvegica]|nr:hypothetical protein G7046_g765 [Stylonectria norvegica]